MATRWSLSERMRVRMRVRMRCPGRLAANNPWSGRARLTIMVFGAAAAQR
jgi:hypothetical protein